MIVPIAIVITLCILRYNSKKRQILYFDDVHDIWNAILHILKSDGYKDFAKHLQQSIRIHETNYGTATTTDYKHIHICTTDFTKDTNSLMYVLIHEMTHIYLKSTEHDDMFFNQFNKFVDLVKKHYDFIQGNPKGRICDYTFSM